MVGRTISHYEILEKVGEGGMGAVYKAKDTHLDRFVAIKFLPPEKVADPDRRRRFTQEAKAASALNHPNIITIYDIDEVQDICFISMELVAGKTLGSLIPQHGMHVGELLKCAVQIADALAKAHAAGIIHRDLKPGNIMVTEQGLVKVLDFGLAKLTEAPIANEDVTRTMRPATEDGEVAGTLPYMAPEQLRGGMADARTDIWAMGTVLYEMATAHRPFEEKVSTALAADIIHQAPPPPRKLRWELSPKLEAIILKCLEKEPAKRYQSSIQLHSDLERLSVGATPLVARRHRLWPAVVSAIALLLGATWYVVAHRTRTESSSMNARRSVAVLGFKNVSGKLDEAWISTALSEMLATELAAGERLRTIPGENVARTKLDLSLPDADSYGRDTLTRIRRNLGADFVVLGSYFDAGREAGGQMRLDLWLQDARAGETVAAVSETGTEAQLLDLVSRTGSVLRSKLGVGEVTSADAGAVRASIPAGPEAARLYAEGLKKLRAFDDLGARDLLEKATVAEPGFPLIHSALAEVWSRLGYDVKAKLEARKAFDLSANLSRADRLSVEARYREANRERIKAIELYRTLFNAFPDNLDYGLRLATMQWRSGKGKDALLTVEALRKMPLPAREDPRIDLAEAYSAESLGDLKRAQAVAASAVIRAETLGAPLLVAAGQLEKCRIFRERGLYQEARKACRSAKDAYDNTGNRERIAVTLVDIGATLFEQGDLAGAQNVEEEALVAFRQAGHESGIALTLSELANVLSVRGDHVGAESRYEQALATYREIEDTANIGAELHNIASELKLQGRLDNASVKYHEALAVNRELGQEDVEAMDLANLGAALCLRGDFTESARTLDQSLEICRRTDFKQACSVALGSQGDLLSWEGKLDQAADKYREALALSKEMGAAIGVAETQVSIAEHSIESGRSWDAERAIREARVVFRKQELIEDEVWANAVLAWALLAQGKVADARKELNAAASRGAKIQNEEVRLKQALVAASVVVASGRPADQVAASHRLEAILSQARKHGFLGYELKARLALGEIEMKIGHTAAGRARLTALEKEARDKGFLLIANKAAAAKS